jgi:hypothetical protein
MPFTIEEPCANPLVALLWAVLIVFGPPVSIGLMLWLRHNPRDARDVLLVVARRPAGLVRRGLDFCGWLFAAGALVGLQVLAMVLMFALLSWFLGSNVFGPGEGMSWVVAPTLATGLLLVGWMVNERGPRAARDVLHVEHAPRRRR